MEKKQDRTAVIVVPKPKSRVPMAPPKQVHEDLRKEEKLRPSQRKAKHKPGKAAGYPDWPPARKD